MNKIINTNTKYEFMMCMNASLSQEVYYSHNKRNEMLITYCTLTSRTSEVEN